MDACHLFPQHVLAIIPLIGGVQVHGLHTRSQEGRGSGWLLVAGPSAEAAGCTYSWGGRGSGWHLAVGLLAAAGGCMHPWGGGGSGWHQVTGPLVLVGCTYSQEGRDSDLHLLIGPLVVAVVHAHLWSLRWQQWLVPVPVACVGGALLPESTRRKKLLWWASPSPHMPPNNGVLPLWWAQASSRTPLVVAHHTLAPSGYLCSANPSLLPRV